MDDEILTKNFNEYVYKKMQAAKINDELINQYYAANPPYMSVAGLKDIGRKMINKLKNILGKEIIPGFKGKLFMEKI